MKEQKYTQKKQNTFSFLLKKRERERREKGRYLSFNNNETTPILDSFCFFPLKKYFFKKINFLRVFQVFLYNIKKKKPFTKMNF